ncbi:Ribonuclease III [Methanosarcina sp. MTP4]|uniref:ribonuclease III family protein n=1 Tax=Methanosarcina sp. MTP4 TaxID=1434100 RepID=UPI0006154446|nr:ribonuclease III domain-containing protein [Methanosarcina sp. MTP4]AKB25584.1 Ribonuclease III [Methanosarcina sp. MTP4]
MNKLNSDLTVSLEFLDEVQHKISVTFNNPAFLIQALLHGTFFSGNKIKLNTFKQKNCLENDNYEKLEYLGDSVLGLIISEYTYHNEEIEDYAKTEGKKIEGALTDVKQVLVPNESLVPLARKINLGKYILQDGLVNVEDVYANVIEAIIGAIFLDQGYPRAKGFVNTFFDIRGALGKVDSSNPKRKLQERCDKKHSYLEYNLINEEGPDHKKQFTYLLSINGEEVSYGYGLKKKDAQKDAAEKYLQSLDEPDVSS